jgi:hypothetical protein
VSKKVKSIGKYYFDSGAKINFTKKIRENFCSVGIVFAHLF